MLGFECQLIPLLSDALMMDRSHAACKTACTQLHRSWRCTACSWPLAADCSGSSLLQLLELYLQGLAAQA